MIFCRPFLLRFDLADWLVWPFNLFQKNKLFQVPASWWYDPLQKTQTDSLLFLFRDQTVF